MKSVSLLLSCFLALIYTVSSDNTACPTFEDGSWAVGEIRTAVNERGQSTRILKRHYSDKTPRSCCDACARIEECKYWTIILTSKTSFVGECYLYESFACQESYDGVLPFIPNRLARSGSNICDAPVANIAANATLEEKRDGAIAEMRALLNAEIAVRVEEAERWQNETEAATQRKIQAEEEAGKWREKAMQLQTSVDKAKKDLAALEEELSLAEGNFTQAATEAVNEAESVALAKKEHGRLLNEIKNARKAKESADLLLATEMAIENEEEKAELESHPYSFCPSGIEKDEWVVGLLRSLTDVTGASTKLNHTTSNAAPLDCCNECGKLENCSFWSWEVQHKTDTEGECSFFTQTGCDADGEGNYPFNQVTRLGRVGSATSCPAATQ